MASAGESTGELDKALACYEKAKDNLSCVRVHCMQVRTRPFDIRFCSPPWSTIFFLKLDCVDIQGDYEAAKTLALATKDPAAAFHLGRHFDHQDNVREAIRFYTQAQRFGNALQLAKRHGMDGELMALALQVRSVLPGPYRRSLSSCKPLNAAARPERGPAATTNTLHTALCQVRLGAEDVGVVGLGRQATAREQLEAALYFEGKNMLDRATVLFHKAGRLDHALDLCFEGQLFDALKTIANDLGEAVAL